MAEVDFRQKHLQFRRLIGTAYMPQFCISQEWKDEMIPALNENYKVLLPTYNLDEFAKKVDYQKISEGYIKFKAIANYKPGGLYKVELFKCNIKSKTKNIYMLVYFELYRLANGVISSSTNKVVDYEIIDNYLVTKIASYKFLELDNKYVSQIIDMLENPSEEYETNIMVYLNGLNSAKDQYTVYNKDVIKMLVNVVNNLEFNEKELEELFNIVRLKARKGVTTITKGLNHEYYLSVFKENYKFETGFNITVSRSEPKVNEFKALHRRTIYKIDSKTLDLQELFMNVPMYIEEEFLKKTMVELGFNLVIDEKLQKLGIALVDWFGVAEIGVPLKIVVPTQFMISLEIPQNNYERTINKYTIGLTKRNPIDILRDFICIVKQESMKDMKLY